MQQLKIIAHPHFLLIFTIWGVPSLLALFLRCAGVGCAVQVRKLTQRGQGGPETSDDEESDEDSEVVDEDYKFGDTSGSKLMDK